MVGEARRAIARRINGQARGLVEDQSLAIEEQYMVS